MPPEAESPPARYSGGKQVETCSNPPGNACIEYLLDDEIWLVAGMKQTRGLNPLFS
jgi:hypothetical protein